MSTLIVQCQGTHPKEGSLAIVLVDAEVIVNDGRLTPGSLVTLGQIREDVSEKRLKM